MSRAARTASQQTTGTPKKIRKKRRTAIIDGSGSFQGPGELAHRLADGVGRVFLDEVEAGNGDLGLVGPRTAELALPADEDGTRFGVDEQLRRRIAARQPFAVGLDVAHHIGRLALDGDLAGPGEGWAPALSGLLV